METPEEILETKYCIPPEVTEEIWRLFQEMLIEQWLEYEK